jgi:hypothetical protein
MKTELFANVVGEILSRLSDHPDIENGDGVPGMWALCKRPFWKPALRNEVPNARLNEAEAADATRAGFDGVIF